MTGVRLVDAGDNLLVTGADEAQVAAALQKLVYRGAMIIAPPYQRGANWSASCSKPPNYYDEPSVLGVGESYVPDRSVFDEINLSDTGRHLIVSGKTKLAVQAALEELRRLGAQNISRIIQIGASWMATCEDPPNEQEQCTVDAFGQHLMVSGPTKAAVERRAEELAVRSGKVVKLEESLDGKWIAVVDTSGPSRW